MRIESRDWTKKTETGNVALIKGREIKAKPPEAAEIWNRPRASLVMFEELKPEINNSG